MFSKTFGYALRAVLYVALQNKFARKVGLAELSRQLGIPHHFLGKIMQDLVRHGFLDSTKGPSGGFRINHRTLETPLIDLLKLTDGLVSFNSCALGLRACSETQPCPLHYEVVQCRTGLLRALNEKTIGALAGSADRDLAFLTPSPSP
jgi:Rrf2 family iron-sulfur cluster assembly transcriptional regulator